MKFNIFEFRIFSFNSYVYYVTPGFITSIRAFNLLTRVFNLPTRAFSVPTRAFNFATRVFNFVTRAFSLLTHGFELVTRGFELVTRVLLFHETKPIPISLPYCIKMYGIISKLILVMLNQKVFF